MSTLLGMTFPDRDFVDRSSYQAIRLTLLLPQKAHLPISVAVLREEIVRGVPDRHWGGQFVLPGLMDPTEREALYAAAAALTRLADGL